MKILLILGPSGAGKTHALHSFEDAGYYAVAGLPPRLLPALIDSCQSEAYEQVAVAVDTHTDAAFAELVTLIQELSKAGLDISLLFLDASDETLIQRYKETRRPHPELNGSTETPADCGIVEAIHAERERLQPLRSLADLLIDTSSLTGAQLRERLYVLRADAERPRLLVTLTSFGFKYGLPLDADLVFDVRFLSNPHYVASLKMLDGRDSRVAEYVHQDPLTEPFFARIRDLIDFTLPQYQQEGKAYLNIAFGCTGGKHRSVVLTEDMAAHLRDAGYALVINHRDLKEGKREEGKGVQVFRYSGVQDNAERDEAGKRQEESRPEDLNTRTPECAP